MKKENKIENMVRRELAEGKRKKQVLADLSRNNDKDDVLFFLNNLPNENQRRRYLWINRLLCLLLLTITIKKLYDMALLQLAAMTTSQFSPLLLLDLIVPMINFYVLSKLIRFQRQGYQFMIVLGVLALVRPENRVMPDLPMHLVIIGLSTLLLLRLFPKKNRLEG